MLPHRHRDGPEPEPIEAACPTCHMPFDTTEQHCGGKNCGWLRCNLDNTVYNPESERWYILRGKPRT